MSVCICKVTEVIWGRYHCEFSTIKELHRDTYIIYTHAYILIGICMWLSVCCQSVFHFIIPFAWEQVTPHIVLQVWRCSAYISSLSRTLTSVSSHLKLTEDNFVEIKRRQEFMHFGAFASFIIDFCWCERVQVQ